MKTLSGTLWNLRSIILILAAPLLLLPLPLVIGTKVSGGRRGDPRAADPLIPLSSQGVAAGACG